MNRLVKAACAAALALAPIVAVSPAAAADNFQGQPSSSACYGLPTYAQLKKALTQATAPNQQNGGLQFNMWGAIVAKDGTVCAVAFTGPSYTSQWLGSRVISAQKANTANDFSLDGFALSTANLYSAVQPGGSLFGLQFSNPVDPSIAYQGSANSYGTANDPLVGQRVGGVNVFGGGLALYSNGKKIGAVGVSGDTSCADHNVSWRVRVALGLAPSGSTGGVNPVNHDDGIVYDIDPATGKSAGGYGHPTCGGNEVTVATSIHSDQ